MLKKILAVLSILMSSMALLGGSVPVSALEAGDIVMSLNPSERELELEPGKTYESSVGVSNIGRLPFDVHASVSPYYVNEEDYTPDFEADTAYTHLNTWITLEKDTYHLEPGQSVKVNFTVKVPEGIAGGGQYAAIMLLSDSGVEEDAAVKVQGQLAAIIYGHVDGADVVKDGELVAHSLPGFMFSHDFSASETVKNNGNVDFRVKQTMTVTDFFSNREVVNADSINDQGQMMGYNTSTVLPGTQRTVKLTWTNAPKLGLFNVKQEISFLDQNYSYTQTVFICPIWLAILIVLAIVGLIVWIVLKVRKRKQKQPEAL